MVKESKNTIDTQIRLAEDLYNYVKSEAKRLGVSMNYVMNGLLDDGRRFRKAKIILQVSEG